MVERSSRRIQQHRDKSGLPAGQTFATFDLIILDDLSYVRKDQVETSALFELIFHRYERRELPQAICRRPHQRC